MSDVDVTYPLAVSNVDVTYPLAVSDVDIAGDDLLSTPLVPKGSVAVHGGHLDSEGSVGGDTEAPPPGQVLPQGLRTAFLRI